MRKKPVLELTIEIKKWSVPSLLFSNMLEEANNKKKTESREINSSLNVPSVPPNSPKNYGCTQITWAKIATNSSYPDDLCIAFVLKISRASSYLLNTGYLATGSHLSVSKNRFIFLTNVRWVESQRHRLWSSACWLHVTNGFFTFQFSLRQILFKKSIRFEWAVRPRAKINFRKRRIQTIYASQQ